MVISRILQYSLPAGDFQLALHYHRAELALSESTGDQMGAGIAHRKVGECLCELGSYEQALQHQMQHLRISKDLGTTPL